MAAAAATPTTQTAPAKSVRTRVLSLAVICERSGAVRDEFRRLGHHAVSFDLHPCEIGGPHVQGDVRNADLSGFNAAIAHPDCTYLCSSGLHWNGRTAGREALTTEALEFVRWIFGLPFEFLALENPIGRISTAIRPPDQTIQPYQFGENASKATCLWLRGFKPLRHTSLVAPRIVWKDGKPAMRWGNQTDSGQNKLGPGDERAAERSRTYPGIARAMAEQWGAT